MEMVSAFLAKDGKLFVSELECKKYESNLKWMEEIAKFWATEHCPYNKGPQVKVMENSIVAWEAYKASNS
jgi:hypothetical protein